jgi:DNA-binding CsgD family transcriptional regulator
LTPKEKQVIKWLKEGKSNWETSAILGISERTVKFHISNIMQKLDASSRAHAVAIAIERGLVERDW